MSSDEDYDSEDDHHHYDYEDEVDHDESNNSNSKLENSNEGGTKRITEDWSPVEECALVEDHFVVSERSLEERFRWFNKGREIFRGNSIQLAMMYFEELIENKDKTFTCVPYSFPDSLRMRNDGYIIHANILLNFYVRENYFGPPTPDEKLPPSFISKMKEIEESRKQDLVLDGEGLIENVRFPGLVLIAEDLLKRFNMTHDNRPKPSAYWWKMRAYFLHQKFLDEKSQVCRENILKAKEEFENEFNRCTFKKETKALFYAELSAVYAYYYDIEGAKEALTMAKGLIGLSATPTGVLGKRTKFQQTNLAQLVLKVDVIPQEVEEFCDIYGKPSIKIAVSTNTNFPQNVLLDDEVRLENISIQDESFQNAVTADQLTEVQHVVLLTEFQLKKIYLPVDEIYREELLAYLSFLIECPKVWCAHLVALLNRSMLEKDHRRSVERSMKQLQTLSRAIESEVPFVCDRQRYFYTTNMPMSWEVEVSLSKILTSLNLHKEALDISIRLKRWEDVIECYTNLNLRHKAEEVIREQLKTNDTVKLWTLLGDATDNTEYYEHAWKLSGAKSARAKRQWGFHCFHKKQYAEAVTHLEESLKLNSLENPAWLRLGFAALEIENWEVSSKAYQYSTTLDADNFEAWNNLAKAFVKLGHKNKALRALREATKCNFDNWKVWENTLVVATDCKAYDEVIRAYNRLFDLKGKWADEEVLAMLTSAIVTDKLDASDNSSQDRYLASTLKLFGRITATITNNSKIWKLYADLLLVKVEREKFSNLEGPRDETLEATWYKSVSYSQRAVQAILADPNWTKGKQSVLDAVEFSLEYIKSVHSFIENFPSSPNKSETLTAVQFTVKRIYNAIKKISETAIQPEEFETLLEDLKKNVSVLEGIQIS